MIFGEFPFVGRRLVQLQFQQTVMPVVWYVTNVVVTVIFHFIFNSIFLSIISSASRVLYWIRLSY